MSWLDGITDSMEMSLSNRIGNGQEAWRGYSSRSKEWDEGLSG